MSEVVFHRLDLDHVLAQLRRWVDEELAARPEVLEVVLIGSLARGDWSASSDADAVVVVDASQEAFRDRSVTYAPRQRVPVSIDLFVYTSAERERWGERFRREVSAGTVLYRRRPL